MAERKVVFRCRTFSLLSASVDNVNVIMRVVVKVRCMLART